MLSKSLKKLFTNKNAADSSAGFDKRRESTNSIRQLFTLEAPPPTAGGSVTSSTRRPSHSPNNTATTTSGSLYRQPSRQRCVKRDVINTKPRLIRARYRGNVDEHSSTDDDDSREGQGQTEGLHNKHTAYKVGLISLVHTRSIL